MVLFEKHRLGVEAIFGSCIYYQVHTNICTIFTNLVSLCGQLEDETATSPWVRSASFGKALRNACIYSRRPLRRRGISLTSANTAHTECGRSCTAKKKKKIKNTYTWFNRNTAKQTQKTYGKDGPSDGAVTADRAVVQLHVSLD